MLFRNFRLQRNSVESAEVHVPNSEFRIRQVQGYARSGPVDAGSLVNVHGDLFS